MRLWETLTNVTTKGVFRLGKNASLEIQDTDGRHQAVTIAQLRNMLVPAQSAVTLTAAKTLTADDSHTTFFLGLAGGFTVTLPAPAAGLKFKFVVSVAPTTAYIITTNGGADIMIGGINELEVDSTEDGPYDNNADTLNFVASVAVVGDYVEMESDGTSWYFHGQTNADGGVTTATS